MLEVAILRRCFGYTAIIFGLVFVFVLPLCLLSIQMLPHFDAAGPALVATIALMTLSLAGATVANGTAWWLIRKGAESARQWSIAASTCLLLISVPFFSTAGLMLHYHAVPVAIYLDLIAGFVLSILGIVGLATFSRYDGLNLVPVRSQTPVSKISDKLLISRAKNPSPICR